MRNTMRRSFKLLSLAAVAIASFSTVALAHVGDHSHMSFTEGLLHPFTGLDHALAMVAVGLWASQLGGRALWLLPLTFPAVMAVGAGVGLSGGAPPVGGVRLARSGVGVGARGGPGPRATPPVRDSV